MFDHRFAVTKFAVACIAWMYVLLLLLSCHTKPILSVTLDEVESIYEKEAREKKIADNSFRRIIKENKATAAATSSSDSEKATYKNKNKNKNKKKKKGDEKEDPLVDNIDLSYDEGPDDEIDMDAPFDPLSELRPDQLATDDSNLDANDDIEAEVPSNIEGINNYDSKGNTFLINAVLAKSAKIVRNMIKGGADPNKASSYGQTPLFIAAKQGSYLTAKELLKAPLINPNIKTVDGSTALLVSIAADHVDVATLLLDHNADPNIAHEDGLSPLMIASQKNQKDVVELLIKYGAHIDRTTNTGETALMFAAISDSTVIVDFLISLNANVNQQNDFGYTPVMLAASRGSTASVKKLLEAGADIEMRDISDRTVFEVLVDRSASEEVLHTLLIYGADNRRRSYITITPKLLAKKEEMMKKLDAIRINKQRTVKDL